MSYNFKNNTPYNLDETEMLAQEFYPFAKKKLGWNMPPTIVFDSEKNNAKDPLGKTAYYNPSTYTITVYVDNRHTKDILRSIAHELVHHSQNCRGEFKNNNLSSEDGYAQKDTHLREMEREAYERGNMCFRDWEDYRQNEIKETNYSKRRFENMSLTEWKNKEIGVLVMEKFGYKVPAEETTEEVNEEVDAFMDLKADYKTAEKTFNEEEDNEDEETEELEETNPASVEQRENNLTSEEINILRTTIKETIKKVLSNKNIVIKKKSNK